MVNDGAGVKRFLFRKVRSQLKRVIFARSPGEAREKAAMVLELTTTDIKLLEEWSQKEKRWKRVYGI